MAVTILIKIENKIKILLENPMAYDKDQTKGVEFLLKQESDFQDLQAPKEDLVSTPTSEMVMEMIDISTG